MTLRALLSVLLLLLLSLLACDRPGGAAPGPMTAAPRATPLPAGAARGGQGLEFLRLPPGFRIEIYAEVPDARSMTLSPKGTLYVGTRAQRVYAVADRDGDHRAESVEVVASGLHQPNGVAFRNGSLYVAEISRVLRFDRVDEGGRTPVVVTDMLPDREHHGWKFIAFGPDGLLYVPVGAPCNVCLEEDPRFAALLRMKPDGSSQEVFASGIRNTVGFDWQPGTGELWFTDNGRDWLGDDLPPDELNRAPRAGMHFGFPYCHGGSLPDPEFTGRSCDEFAAPAQNLGPHVAALGMRFYTGSAFPQEYRGDIFIAEHGSWNRSTPIDYRVTRVQVEGGRATSYEVFAEGWLQRRRVHGRPVDTLIMPDGALLVSDDHAGRIYRISYSGSR